jgi:hypothetical protein
MLLTNIILLLAFIAMIGIAVWLFRGDDRPTEQPTIVRIKDADSDGDEDGPRG